MGPFKRLAAQMKLLAYDDLRQFDDLVHALDAILHRDLKDWMLSNGDPLTLGFLNSEYSAPLNSPS